MKKLTEKEICDIENNFISTNWTGGYNASRFASDATAKQIWYLNKLLDAQGYDRLNGAIRMRKGMVQALIWWLLELDE